MDHALLEAVSRELAGALLGHAVTDLIQLESHRFLLRFDGAPFPRVHIGIHPRLSTIHLARGIKAPSKPTELSGSFTRELQGGVVTGVEKPAGERLVLISFGQERVLVVEMMGKASNLLLLDEKGRILRFARTHRGGFRVPVAGEMYELPPSPPEATSAEFSLSMALTREIEYQTAKGKERARVEEDLRTRMRGEPEPVLYTPAPLDRLAESVPLSGANLFAFPFPVEHAENLTATPFETVNEAEETATQCRVAHARYMALRDAVASRIKSERKKNKSLLSTLEKEFAEAEKTTTRDRRRGELILAGLHAAVQEGSEVRVPDPYDEQGGAVTIPIDPRLDLKSNAERFFKKARKARRTCDVLPARIEKLRLRRDLLEKGAARLEKNRTSSRLEQIEKELQDEGLVRAVRRAERPEVGRKAEYVPVREFTTQDGFLVLVGRSGKDNDHLTFKVAGPHDLWLHASDSPGAHVVVRNPGKLGSMPETTVLEAAAIAAHFSKVGKGGAPVEVHVAWRRHVRKGRGMSPGMVMLKKHRSVRVAPGLPPSQGVVH